MEVPKKELAELFGISVQSLNIHIANGMPGRRGAGPRTKYDVAEALAWFVSFSINQAMKSRSSDGSPTQYDRESLEAEKVFWQVESAKHKSLLESGELVTVTDADKELNHRLTQVRESLDAIPGSWSPFLVGLTSQEQAQRTLTEQLDSLYQTLSSLPDSELEATSYELDDSESVVPEEIDDSDSTNSEA